ncbi:MAG: putative ABC transport system ATP-binding protein, partial [Rickettsiales bacterium]
PSGSGKTSLLCLLDGSQKPTYGNIFYDNNDIYQLKPETRDRFRGRNLGIIFQNFHLIEHLNDYQNIEIYGQMLGDKTNHNQINDYSKELGLEEKAKHKFTDLSFGQSQRLAVIRIFINKPKWILCEEPNSALDGENTDKLLKSEEKKTAHPQLL